MNEHDLKLILNSNISLVVLETYDEPRALELLKKFFRSEHMPAWSWSVTDGIKNLGFGMGDDALAKHTEAEVALSYIKSQTRPGAYVLCDMHPFLDEPKVVRLLKDIALCHSDLAHKVVLLSHSLCLPPEIARYAASLKMSLPSEEEILSIIREEAKLWSNCNGGSRIKTDNLTLQKLVGNLKGLPHQDVRRLARGAIADDGAITESDLPAVSKTKFALMDMEGVLHFEFSTAHMGDVAGLNRMKAWLEQRRQVFLEASDRSDEGGSSLDKPKGLLLFGVQGGGKSLAAKAIAGIWGIPLLRLDMAALYNKFIGETEKNLREALKLADLMSPCVLWIDELEKGLAQDGGDSALPKRLLGTLLTWMAERKSSVFMVATSNDISQLPPELMRKGRFDEIFFVDLPCINTRSAIFDIHLAKRGFCSADFNLADLSLVSEGFTGAEIEQAIVSAIYAASAQSEPLSDALIEAAIVNTQPLSVIMAEKIQSLRAWAAERAVPAD